MTFTLIRKLLRDYRATLLVMMLLLAAFQCLWAKITERIVGQLNPLLSTLAGAAGLSIRDVENMIFEGPGQLIRTVIGGDMIVLENAMDVMTIGYVHPLMVTVFCIWGIGRAAGAIAGELDRGTMELLLAQPVARSRLVLAHFLVDAITIPALCLSLWAGTFLGTWLVSPIQVQEFKSPKLPSLGTPPGIDLDGMGRGKADVLLLLLKESKEHQEARLRIDPASFGPALVLVGGLVFAVCGATMWLSALGRYRWRVLGLAVLIALVQFIMNLVGLMWDQARWLCPLSIFHYYQPQQVILHHDWCVNLSEWNGGSHLLLVPMPAVLFGIGLVGYGLARLTFCRRDLPAPL